MLVVRRLRAGERDSEKMWLAILAGLALAAMGWLALGLPTPVCPLHQLTGVPCMTCGGTRCLRSALHGDFVSAFRWNPLVFCGFLALGAYCTYAAMVVGLRLPRLRFGELSGTVRRSVLAIAVVAGLANWIYLIRHL